MIVSMHVACACLHGGLRQGSLSVHACEQVEPLRLSAHAQWKGQPTREQQQLHYQWFADLGSTEAKRALGQMLTQGAHKDPVSALRYFRSAALPLHSNWESLCGPVVAQSWSLDRKTAQ